jgi:hypothetical protein
MKSPVVMFALGILFAVAILAQDTGSITGTVRDTTGAVIPGAKVTLRNTAQGSIYKTISNSTGDYLVGGLPAGRYDLSISVKDFKGYEARGIVLRVAQKPGTYKEGVVVGIPLSLRGANPERTAIDATGQPNGVLIDGFNHAGLRVRAV